MNTPTTKQTFTAFLKDNGFGFAPHAKHDDLITLTGEWLSPHDEDVFASDATIEHISGPVYRVSDCSGDYRLEVYPGSGPDGIISDWEAEAPESELEAQ